MAVQHWRKLQRLLAALGPVGRLMQVLRASQIWAFYISGCGRLYHRKRWCSMITTIERNHQSTDDEVLQKWGRQHCLLNLGCSYSHPYSTNLQVSAISVVEREGVVCWNAWVQAINNWMGMDSGTHSCMHIVTRQVKWERLLNPSKRWNSVTSCWYKC